ncbi:MAG: YitT family protein [Candidatus Gastranaerophilaceae bacterium]|nr:YitT family protein [Christensenellales bacterium]
MELKQKKSFVDFMWDAVSIIFGCMIMAFGMVMFTIPNNIAPGGLSGLATALSYLISETVGVSIGVGILTFAMQVPIIIIAMKVFGLKALITTVITAVAYSGSIELVSLIPNLYTHTDNLLLAAVMGGAAIGLGVAILFMRGLATGGTDTVSMVLRVKFPRIRAGSLMMTVDAVVVLAAVIIFGDIEVALYSGISIFVMGKVIDAVMQGFDYARVFFIITDRAEAILHALAEEMGRGVTEIRVRGGYTHEDKKMLMTVARKGEVSLTLKLIKRVDPGAFLIMFNATEVIGKGFKDIAKEVTDD